MSAGRKFFTALWAALLVASIVWRETQPWWVIPVFYVWLIFGEIHGSINDRLIASLREGERLNDNLIDAQRSLIAHLDRMLTSLQSRGAATDTTNDPRTP